jgi:hypothetical protein
MVINDINDTVVLAAGNFKVYTNKALQLQPIATGVLPNTVIKNEVLLYPNPSTDLVYLELNQFQQKPNVNFYDATGKSMQLPMEIVQQANATYLVQINTAVLPTGVYFVKIDNSLNGSSVVRFLKN